MRDISTVIDENCTKKGAKKGTQMMSRRAHYQQKSGGYVCEVRSVFFPFFKIGEIIERLLSYILHPVFFVIIQIICGSCQLLLSGKIGTHHIVDIAEESVFEKTEYLSFSHRLSSAKGIKRDYLKVTARNWTTAIYITSYLKMSENNLVIDCETNFADIAPVLDSEPFTLDDNDELHIIVRRAPCYVCDPSRGVAQENFQSELRVYPIGLYIPVAN